MDASVESLQAYLRHSAQQQYQAIPVPPFTLFINSTNAFKFFNYAIPDQPVEGDLREPLNRLQGEFIAAGRQPRIEYLEEYAPDLGQALEAAGYKLEGRQQFMVCRREDFKPTPEIAGLRFGRLEKESGADEIREFILTQRQGFNPAEPGWVDGNDLSAFQVTLEHSTGIIARLDGSPVAAAMVSEPYKGMSEITGITTLEPYRYKGVGTAITAEAARAAFEGGVELLCLTAADRQAGRIYERVGFKPFAISLSYEQEID